MFDQFGAMIRDIDRQIEAKQERLVEQRAALGDIQSGLDRLRRALAAEPVEAAQTRRPAKGVDMPAEGAEHAYGAEIVSNGHAGEMPTTTTAAAAGEASAAGVCAAIGAATEAPRSNGAAQPAGPVCQAPGCGKPLPASTGPGPPRRYCGGDCRRVAREARVAARVAGEEVPADVPFAPAGGA